MWKTAKHWVHNGCASLLLVALACINLPVLAQQGEYSELFDTLKPGLFIIESVERISNNKHSIGSGFAVVGDGLMATNYHVVADAVLKPDQYQLRYQSADGKDGQLELVVVDVLYDLALVRAVDDDGQTIDLPVYFTLADALPEAGNTVLAMGNPYDLGLSIVPGTHNGLLERQFRQTIHFTGALNPGMSGGPAVNTEGEVVGVNVAGAGNSVSFLVPVERVHNLVEQMASAPATLEAQREQIVDSIRVHQDD
ncbi:MAG: trypsin-like peptidase domain-containing protein, partial [Pseudomonadota bacterium]